MKKALQRLLAWTLIACLPLVIAACGGSSHDAAPAPQTTLSGVATMGTNQGIQGAAVAVYVLGANGQTGALLGTGTTDSSGAYSIQIPVTSESFLVAVTGQPGSSYTRITNGQSVQIPFANTEMLRAVAVASTAFVAVTPLTEAGYQKLQQILTVNPALVTDARIITAANDRIASLLGTGNILANPAGDTMYQAVLLCIDQMIVDKGAGANTVTVMNIINQAFADAKLANPAYQTYLQALTAAANKLKLANPGNTTLIALLDAIVARAANPANEPNWNDISPPTAPSNLTASTTALNANTSSVLLSWSPATDNKAVAGYDIYRDNIKIATVTSTSYLDPSLANATYTYYLIAFDAVGNRSIASYPPFKVELGLPDTIPPTQPQYLSAATFPTATTSSVVLMWSVSTDNVAVAGYDVYRDNIKIATVTLPGYEDTNRALSTTYKYYVVAFDAAGNRSEKSKELSVTPNLPSLGVTVNGQIVVTPGSPSTDITSPTPPSNLLASTTAKTATTSDVLLTWSPATDNVGVAGYEVYRNGVRIATVTLLGYTDAGVTSNVTYTYFIIAFDAAGNRSLASSQLLVTPNQASLGVTVNGQVSGPPGATQPDVTAPSAPTNLLASTTAKTATTSDVLLTWNPSTDNVAVTGYDVYRNGSKIATVTLLGYTDAGVTSNVTYTYYVIAFDAAGNRSLASYPLLVKPNQASLGVTVNGQVSGTPGATQPDVTAPSAPTNLLASTTAKTATTSDVLLTWSPATDNVAVTGYDVYRNGSKIATVTLLGYTDAGVTSNVTYTYYVIAFDAAGNRSLASSQLLVKPNQASLGVTVNGQVSGSTGSPQTDVTAPSAPTNLSASTTAKTATTSDVLLTWSPATDNVAVTGYDVYRNGSKIATVTLLGYTDAGVTSNITYTYYVIAFDAAGNRSLASSQLPVKPNQASLGVTVNGQVSVTTGSPQTDVTAPSAPTNLSASTTAKTATTSDVLLTWSPATDNIAVTGYDLYRNGSKIATTSSPGFTNAAVTSNVTYVYTVNAFDAAGNHSLSSNQISVTPPPLNLNITVGGQITTP